MHGTITTHVVRLTHPITGRFIAEYDIVRGLLWVVDRGKEAAIDLVRIEQAQTGGANHVGTQANNRGEAVSDGTAVPEGRTQDGEAGLHGPECHQ